MTEFLFSLGDGNTFLEYLGRLETWGKCIKSVKVNNKIKTSLRNILVCKLQKQFFFYQNSLNNSGTAPYGEINKCDRLTCLRIRGREHGEGRMSRHLKHLSINLILWYSHKWLSREPGAFVFIYVKSSRVNSRVWPEAYAKINSRLFWVKKVKCAISSRLLNLNLVDVFMWSKNTK